MSKDIAKPKSEEIILVKNYKFSFIIILVLSVPFLLLVAIVEKGWLFFIFAAIYFIITTYKIIKFRIHALIVLSKEGIKYKSSFISWTEVTDAYLQMKLDDFMGEKTYLILKTNNKKKSIEISGLDRSVDEIEHFTECFRSNNYA